MLPQRPAEVDPIIHRLAHPHRTVNLVEALDSWRWTDVIVIGRLPPQFEEVPDLPDRIRGALGRRLEAKRDGGTRAQSLYDIMFGTICGTHGSAIRPYVIRCDRCGDRLAVVLRITGFAALLAAEAAVALHAALEGGIALKSHARMRLPIAVETMRILPRRGLPQRKSPTSAMLHFLTPLAIRRGSAVSGDLSRLPLNLHNRLSALARWQDWSLVRPDADVLAAVRQLSFLDLDLRAESWLRFSSTTGAKAAHIRGFVGRSIISGPVQQVWPLLRFGEYFHGGGECALGLGRYAIYG
jgi:hypothetical protein